MKCLFCPHFASFCRYFYIGPHLKLIVALDLGQNNLSKVVLGCPGQALDNAFDLALDNAFSPGR